MLYVIIAIALVALLYVYFLGRSLVKKNPGNERMQYIAGSIAKGAVAFLKAEYKILAIFIVTLGVLLALTANSETSSMFVGVSYVLWAAFSALAWFIGMKIATKSNVRTTQAATTSLSQALNISFGGGSVMGITVVSLGILWLAVLFLLYSHLYWTGDSFSLMKILNILTGFSLGAESVALFARVGGGIFTKAADVWADLVGKIEAGIPEDDPRNPAAIADNVGDNVGDVAGMGADLFGSYVSTIIATMILGVGVSVSQWNNWVTSIPGVLFPLIISALWIIFSILGSRMVRIKESGNPQLALNIGNFWSIIMTAIASFGVIKFLFPSTVMISGEVYPSIYLFWSIIVWLVVGTLISIITEYFCAKGKRPVKHITRNSLSGAGTNVIAGISVWMISTALPIILLALGIVAAYFFGGVYGVALAATGMMATTGIQLAIDAFGPIADNAGGIAEMSHLDKKVRERTDILDSVGNTTAAIGKGFAVASAALTSLALFSAYKEAVGIPGIDISNAKVLAGLFVGGMVPFLFSGLAIRAVGNSANAMVKEVRRQFKEIVGLLEGKPWVEADYERCVNISTKAALKEMLLPGLLTIISPIVIGFIGGGEVLGWFLVGVTICGVLAAIFQSNAGWAWDNAKKMIESYEDGHEHHYKGSNSHKASVVWDTVGDPLKDTSGPSLNILIKLISIIALVIAPLIK